MLSDRHARPGRGPAYAGSHPPPHGRGMSSGGGRGGGQRVARLPHWGARARADPVRHRPSAVPGRGRARDRHRVRAAAPGARRRGGATVPACGRGGLVRGRRLVRAGRGAGASGPAARRRGSLAPGGRARAGLRGRRGSTARLGRGLGARAPGGSTEPGAPRAGAHTGRALRGADRARLGVVLRQRGQPRRRAAGQVPVPVSRRRLDIRALARADRGGECEHGAPVYHPPARILSGAGALE